MVRGMLGVANRYKPIPRNSDRAEAIQNGSVFTGFGKIMWAMSCRSLMS